MLHILQGEKSEGIRVKSSITNEGRLTICKFWRNKPRMKIKGQCMCDVRYRIKQFCAMLWDQIIKNKNKSLDVQTFFLIGSNSKIIEIFTTQKMQYLDLLPQIGFSKV